MTWGSELRDTPSNTVVRSTLLAWAIALTMLTGVDLVGAQEAAVTDAAPARLKQPISPPMPRSPRYRHRRPIPPVRYWTTSQANRFQTSPCPSQWTSKPDRSPT